MNISTKCTKCGWPLRWASMCVIKCFVCGYRHTREDFDALRQKEEEKASRRILAASK